MSFVRINNRNNLEVLPVYLPYARLIPRQDPIWGILTNKVDQIRKNSTKQHTIFNVMIVPLRLRLVLSEMRIDHLESICIDTEHQLFSR